jgi:hypothetical protein
MQNSYCNSWKASFYYVENRMGNYITIDEAKAIVKKTVGFLLKPSKGLRPSIRVRALIPARPTTCNWPKH